MPFDTQFQLGLELTRFVPLDLLGSKAAEAAIELAKRLQNSGSDLLVEHDLAAVFGRCRISQQLESSFKTLVAQSSTQPTPPYESIMLSSGPGPTENIAGVLTACEEQTVTFDWNRILLAIAMTLQYDKADAAHAISPVVLRGAMDMFPLVQHLREDCLVHIQTNYGICAIVAWAHSILDLTVLVKAEDGTETTFGEGQEQVILEVSRTFLDTTISLLGATGEVLLRLEHQEDDFQIESAPKVSLRGYGKKYLTGMSLNAAMLEELTFVVVSFGIDVMQRLIIYNQSEEPKGPTETPCGLTVRQVVAAAKVIFDQNDIRQAKLDVFINTYSGSEAIADCPAPASIQAYCHMTGHPERTQEFWENTTIRLIPLIVALVALAHIEPLDEIDELPLTAVRVLEEHRLTNVLRHWQGRAPICVQDDTFFNAVALLLGLRIDANPYLDTVCLLSNRGWSVYFDVFGDMDPVYSDSVRLRITKGIPVRNGITKHGIVDGPRSGLDHRDGKFLQRLYLDLKNIDKVERLPLLCAERNDYVSVSHSPHYTNQGSTMIQRTGFRECHRAIWDTKIAATCLHAIESDHKIVIPPNTIISEGFSTMKELKAKGEKFVVFPTARNPVARWRALLAVSGSNEADILLRPANCCLNCLMAQAAMADGRCYVIL